MQQLSQINARYRQKPIDRIMQGDIFEDVPVLRWELVDEEKITTKDPDRLKFAIVLSQECDLDADFRNWRDAARKDHDKCLPSVLVCPAYPSEQFKLGEHLGPEKPMLNWKKQGLFDQIKKNNHARFHFLEKATQSDNENGIYVPSLVVDFKHYHALPIKAVYRLYDLGHYVGSINELFREELSHRFSFYLGRIGVPPLENCPPCGKEEKIKS
jgi:hypothetical protein